ncbi:MAG TPA: DNA primase [Acidimicrobiales bacterium]|nr:DNA primase [Acidimicrobiales bacterium]
MADGDRVDQRAALPAFDRAGLPTTPPVASGSVGILDEDVAAVRAASDIVAVVTQYVPLRKVGTQWLGRCPFHNENTPSFSVSGTENVFYCFGCQARGDVISFVQMQEGLDFPSAVEWLAAKANMTVNYTDRQQGEGRKKRARLVEVMEQAAEWFHQRLLTAPDAGAARSYLRGRGLDGDVVREFRLGWAPDSWDELCKALRLDEKTARDTGLGRRNARGRLQDHFRARVLFPIADDQGRVISFGGRILPGGERPGNQGKYQNTTETPLYTKSKVLYGLDRAKRAVVAKDTVVVCEGYTDVIGFHRSGVPLAVATCGTALTDDHVTLLRRFARRFVLAFDADGAGQAAAERFYRWEREHDLEVAVADLPPGQDPGDVFRTDPAALAASVDNARPFLRFRLDRAFAAADLSTPEGRARGATRALDLVAEHPDVLVRDQYILDVAGRCRVEPDLLRRQLEERRRAGPSSSASGGRSSGVRSPGGRSPSGGRSSSGGGAGSRPGGSTRPSGPPPHGSERRPPARPAGGGAAPAEGRPGAGGGPGAAPARSSGPPPAGAEGDSVVPNAPDELPPEYFAQMGGPPPAGTRPGGDPGDVDYGGDPGPGGYGSDRGWDGGGFAGGGRDGRGDRGGGRGGNGGRFDRRPGGGSDRFGGRGGRGRHAGGRDMRFAGPPSPRIDPVASAERRRAAIEVLRHAVHDPASVGRHLDEALFEEPAHLAVFRALVEHDTHADAVAALPGPASSLLSRLLVEQPTHDALDSLCQLLRTVVWRELRMLNVGTSDDPESILRDTVLLNGVLTDLDHRRPDAANEAAGRLLAWLRARVGDGG